MNRKIGVILSYVLMIFEVLSTLFLTPFILRNIGQAEYGVYKLSAAITSYLLLLDLGVGNALIKYISQFRVLNDKESEKKFLGISQLFYLCVAILVIALSIIMVFVFPKSFSKGLTSEEIELGKKLLIVSSVNAAVTMVSAPYTNMLIAYEKFAVSKLASIIQIIIRIGATFLFLKLGFNSLAIVLINLTLSVLCKTFFILYCFIVLKAKLSLQQISKSFVKEIVVYSSLILVQMIATQINSFIDQVLIGALVSGASVLIAIYGIGTQIVQYFQSIGSAFTNVLMPGVVKLTENNESPETLCKEMIRIGRIILIVLGIIFVTFLFYGQQFIVLWVGSENSDSYYVASLLMLAYLFILVQSIGNQILWAKNIHKEISLIKLGIVIMNIFLTILLIKWNAFFGALIGTFISLLIGDVVLSNIVYKIKLKISLLELFKGYGKGLFLSLLITSVFAFAFHFVGLKGWLGFIINSSATVSIYLICLFTFGLNSYEKNTIFSLFKKIKLKK